MARKSMKERMLCMCIGTREGQEEGVGIAGQWVSAGDERSPQRGEPHSRQKMHKQGKKPSRELLSAAGRCNLGNQKAKCYAKLLSVPSLLHTEHTPSPAPAAPLSVLRLSTASIP